MNLLLSGFQKGLGCRIGSAIEGRSCLGQPLTLYWAAPHDLAHSVRHSDFPRPVLVIALNTPSTPQIVAFQIDDADRRAILNNLVCLATVADSLSAETLKIIDMLLSRESSHLFLSYETCHFHLESVQVNTSLSIVTSHGYGSLKETVPFLPDHR